MTAARRHLWSALLLLSVAIVASEDQATTNTVGGCDSDTISANVPLSQITPNQFVKICPPQLSSSLGQPICGDGTYFSFFFSKPIQRKANQNKILLEFMGGGACWSDETCNYQADYITFPEKLNNFVGLSCSEITYGMENGNYNGRFPVSMLCSRTIGDVDFTEYNTIVVPYCTQDVHIGDNTITYEYGTTMNHRGGHNTMSVLRWIFKNFPSPSHIALTGCSAGGTVLPVVYDLLYKHYNKFGRARSTQISVLADSPTYLTPSYFLNYAFGDWRPKTLMSKIGFNFDKWRYSTDYPTRVWDHVLRRGSNRDQWGLFTHTDDPIQQFYYKWMSGNGEGNYEGRRRLEDDVSSQWWSELTDSISTIKSKHKNVDSYFIEGEEHCSFGLYYPLQEDANFESWAAGIFQEQRVNPKTPALALFLVSGVLGVALFVGAYHALKKKAIELDDGGILDGETKELAQKTSRPVLAYCVSCSSFAKRWPITASYMIFVTFYFWTMLMSQGFVHPLNNPSLGPSATSLSAFGINNPSLIIYKGQAFRLVTSCFLCSGILTYILVMLFFWSFARPLERLMNDTRNYAVILVLIMLGCNLVYALAGNGASCSSVAVALGLTTAFMILRRRMEDASIVGPSIATVFVLLLVAFLFPFNSWMILTSAVLVAALVSTLVVRIQTEEPMQYDLQDSEHISIKHDSVYENPMRIKGRALAAVALSLVLLLILLMARVRRPNPRYLQPYYTGCDLTYTDELDSLSDAYGNFRRRHLEDKGSTLCAQVCLPHLISRGAGYGAQRLLGVQLSTGECQDAGYTEHMADKTFNYVLGYSLDVELFTPQQEEGNGH